MNGAVELDRIVKYEEDYGDAEYEDTGFDIEAGFDDAQVDSVDLNTGVGFDLDKDFGGSSPEIKEVDEFAVKQKATSLMGFLKEAMPDQQTNVLFMSEYSTKAEVAEATAAREELLSDKGPTLELYKLNEYNKQKTLLDRFKMHARNVEKQYQGREFDLADTITGMQSQIASLQEESRNQTGAEKVNSFSINEINTNINMAQRTLGNKIIEYKIVGNKHHLMNRFLKEYIRLWEEHLVQGKLVEYKYRRSAMMKDAEIDKERMVSCTCGNCGERNHFPNNKLPQLNIGKYEIELDVKANIEKMNEIAEFVNESILTNAISILEPVYKSAGGEDLGEMSKRDKIKILAVPQIENAIPDPAIRNQYLKGIKPQLGRDERSDLAGLLSMLQLSSTPLPEGTAKFFKSIKTPNNLNVLKNTHPLLELTGVDEINKVEPTHQASYMKYEGTERYEFLYSNFQKCFKYPSSNHMYNHRMRPVVNLINTSPLRFEIPDVHCKKCQAVLMLYYPIVQAAKGFLGHRLGKVTAHKLQDKEVVLIDGILTPIMTPKLKQKVVKRTLEYDFSKVYRKDKDALQAPTVIIDTNIDERLKDFVGKSPMNRGHNEINQVRREFNLRTEQLAIEMCKAREEQDFIAMKDIIRRNNPQQDGAVEEVAAGVDLELDLSDAVLGEAAPTQEIEVVSEESIESLLDEYGEVDLDTLSIEELTATGYYKIENYAKMHNLKINSDDTIEDLLMRVSGDEDTVNELPRALAEAVLEVYEIQEATLRDLDDSGMGTTSNMGGFF